MVFLDVGEFLFLGCERLITEAPAADEDQRHVSPFRKNLRSEQVVLAGTLHLPKGFAVEANTIGGDHDKIFVRSRRESGGGAANSRMDVRSVRLVDGFSVDRLLATYHHFECVQSTFECRHSLNSVYAGYSTFYAVKNLLFIHPPISEVSKPIAAAKP